MPPVITEPQPVAVRLVSPLSTKEDPTGLEIGESVSLKAVPYLKGETLRAFLIMSAALGMRAKKTQETTRSKKVPWPAKRGKLGKPPKVPPTWETPAKS